MLLKLLRLPGCAVSRLDGSCDPGSCGYLRRELDLYFFLLIRYTFLIDFFAGSKTAKLDFDELHCLLVVATVNSGFQEL